MSSTQFLKILFVLQQIALLNGFAPSSCLSPVSPQWAPDHNCFEGAKSSNAPHKHCNENNDIIILNAAPSPVTERQKSKKMTSLHFKGEKVYKSEPVPIMHSHPSDLPSFLAKNEVRSMLLNGERENSIELIPNDKVTEKTLDLWMKQCQIVGGVYPSMPEDAVFKVNTGAMNFSGLKIHSNSLIGVKFLEESENDPNCGNPEYQLVFIKDDPVAEGPKLLVWIYNQLTGKNKQNDEDDGDNEKEQTIRAFSRFSYEATPDGKSLVFALESTLEVIVKFPSLLLKIIPVSKEKAEEQGSASVLKVMGKDIEAVLPKVREYYVKTFQELKV